MTQLQEKSLFISHVEPIIIFLWVYHQRGGACSRHCYFPSGSSSCPILIRSTVALTVRCCRIIFGCCTLFFLVLIPFVLLATLIEKPQLEFMNDCAGGAHAIRQIKLDFMTAHGSNGIQLVSGPTPRPALGPFYGPSFSVPSIP